MVTTASGSIGSAPTSHLAGSDHIEVVLSHLDRLPTIPAVAAKLLSLTTSDKSCAQDVVAILETDPSLTATLFRLARCTDHGLRVEQLTVSRIVALLGFRRVRNAILSVQIHSLLGGSQDEQIADHMRQDLWKHSLAVACVADMLSTHISGALAWGDAFVCGLLHDIGKTALDAAMPKSYLRIMDLVQRQRVCICDAEHEVFGIDHMIAGKRLAIKWNLPPTVIECIRMHHQDPGTLPTSVTNPRMVWLIQTADHIVRQQHIGFSGYRDTHELSTLLHHGSVDDSIVDRIVEQLPQRMSGYSQLIGLDQHDGRSLYAQSVVKANVELSNINAALITSKQQLDRAQACLRAINVLTQEVTVESTLTDACYTVAHAALEMQPGSQSFVFILSEGSRTMYSAGVSVSGEELPAHIIPVVDQEHAFIHKEFEKLNNRNSPVMAPEPCISMWRSKGFSGRSDSVRMLPICHNNVPVGALLFHSESTSAAVGSSDDSQWHSFSHTINLAVANVRTRQSIESSNDELLDLNRRLHATQRDLVRSRSISMIAEMAAGAAHELNNPLSVISARSQMELQNCQNPQQAQIWHSLIEQTKNAAQIVTDLMSFAKPGPPQPTKLSFEELIHKVAQYWESRSDFKLSQLSLSLADSHVTVFADPNHLNQILNAVLENAIFATNPKTRLLKINSPSSASDETIRIVMEDNGVGMTGAVREHAIDPFFSHREAGRGRGLGLSLAHRLVGHNGGELWISSTPHVGTAVTIQLPARALP